MNIYTEIITAIVATIGSWGYLGIFLLMFLESTFFPFPSEVVMIPAGYLISQGEMNMLLVLVMGAVGSILGAWLNYSIALFFGRKVLLRLIKKQSLEKVEFFFEKHGEISTFNGRLIPVVRQYISFPAGLAKMNPLKFTIYTFLGSVIWTALLMGIGYFLGQNQSLIKVYMKEITVVVVLFVIGTTLLYVWYKKKR